MTLLTGFLVLWCGLGDVTAILAAAYGRDFLAWLVLGVLFGVFSLILVIALPKPGPAGESASAPTAAGNKECPGCHAHVIDWARKCKHCGHSFDQLSASSAA